MNSDYNSAYLPKAFHYYGMNKIKAGKGYRDGVPLGRIGGPCDECGTPVISIQMNTSSKGMECTSEKVCPSCGLVHQGAFAVLQRYETKYTSKSYDTHEAWLIDAKKSETGNYEDIDANCEAWALYNGKREMTDDDVSYGGNRESDNKSFSNRATNKNYINAIRRLNDNKEIPGNVMREYEYVDIAKDYANELGMNKAQLDEVLGLLKIRKNIFNTRYSMDLIILALCITIYTRKMPNISRGRILKEYYKTNPQLKRVYKFILKYT